MNEQMIFQTISQVATQLKMSGLSEADAVAKASSFIQKIVTSARTVSGGQNEPMFFQTLSQLAISYFFREGKTEDEAVASATNFVNSMKVEASTIASN
jgi:hypothetical protein